MNRGKRNWVIRSAALAALPLAAMRIGPANAATITLGASQDATIFGSPYMGNSLSDPGIFVGTDATSPTPSVKRGLIQFDIADSIPTGSVILSAQLNLALGQSPSGTPASETISLYDLSRAWGQSTNKLSQNSFSGNGTGATANTGDATWVYAQNSSVFWTTAGGDFSATASASTSVGTATAATSGSITSGIYSWSSSAMVTDVQNWLNSPSANDGWLLENGDEISSKTFRAFWSAQGAANLSDSGLAPQLVITYVPEPASAVTALMIIGATALTRRRRRLACAKNSRAFAFSSSPCTQAFGSEAQARRGED